MQGVETTRAMASERPYSGIPLTAVALATSFVEMGCKPEDEPQLGEIGQLYLDFVDTLGRGNELDCECAVEAGYYDSVELCRQPAVPPPMADCIAHVLDDFADVATHLECVNDSYAQYFECVEEAGCQGDSYACYLMLLEFDPCPEIPYAATRAVQKECYGVTLPEPFTCADGMQIPETWQCDEEADCDDASDEQDCPSFTCDDGSEVLLSSQCDSVPNCEDFSDERDCPNQFTCGDGYGIPLAWQCDGYEDCSDGSDEQGC
jgi:hypothetical protein